MTRTRWLLNRLAAALAGATLVGLIATVIIGGFDALTCGTRCENLWPSLLDSVPLILAVAIAFGLLPGIAALTLTPAKAHPWRSLPRLVLGTSAGFTIWLHVILHFSLQSDGRSLLLLFIFPTLTGLATAFTFRPSTPGRNPAIV